MTLLFLQKNKISARKGTHDFFYFDTFIFSKVTFIFGSRTFNFLKMTKFTVFTAYIWSAWIKTDRLAAIKGKFLIPYA